MLGWLTALGGIVYLLALLPALHGRLGISRLLEDVTGQVTGHVVSVVLGLLLILIAGQLRRGKRRAWEAALAFFAIAAVAHVLKGPAPIVAVYSIAMVVALVVNRDAFPARPDPGSLLDVARFVPLYAGLVLVFGFGTLLLESEHVEESLSFFGILETTVLGLIGLDGPYSYTGRFFSDFFPAALLALGIAGLAVLCVLVFRAVRYSGAPSADDRSRARALVRAYGWDTLDYFALRSDKSYFFSAAGDAMVAFTYISGYALVAADPIGAPGSEARVLDEFLAYCRERGWHVGVPRGARGRTCRSTASAASARCTWATRRSSPATASRSAGPAMKSVRSAVKRVDKRCSFRLMRETDASPQLCAQLNEIRGALAGQGARAGLHDGARRRGARREPRLPAGGGDGAWTGGRWASCVWCRASASDPGWSLDLMQRDPDAPNGMTEYLIANAALALGERGFRRLSMNFAAWGRLFDQAAELSLVAAGAEEGRRGAQPVLPDQVAARLQPEVRSGLGAALDRGGGRGVDAEGGAALCERRGLREPAGGRGAARAAIAHPRTFRDGESTNRLWR